MGIDDDNKLSTVTYLPQLNSFSIGLPGSPDNKAALEVAKFLGTKHHGHDLHHRGRAQRAVRRHLPPRDVRRDHHPRLHAHVPAVAQDQGHGHQDGAERRGQRRDLRRLPVLPRPPPDKTAFHEETVRRVKNLHLADCLRANKSTSAWGLEARVPFLDKQVRKKKKKKKRKKEQKKEEKRERDLCAFFG